MKWWLVITEVAVKLWDNRSKIKDLLHRINVANKILSFRIKRDVLRKEYITPQQFMKLYKDKSKSFIIREIVAVAAKINKTDMVLPEGYKKELRKASKKQLIRTLMNLIIKKQFGYKEAE